MKIAKLDMFLGNYDLAVEARLSSWREAKLNHRIWQKDGTIWLSKPNEVATSSTLVNSLGWLSIVDTMQTKAQDLLNFANQIKEEGFRYVVLLGMGGSSLPPEAFVKIFDSAPDYPTLFILDSTNPLSVQSMVDKINLAKTLFIVSSKSGRTLETLSFYKYFFEMLSQINDTPGRNFVTITDPDTPLEKLAIQKGFRRIFSAPVDVGGCYAPLTYFGLVPASLLGLDIPKLLKHTQIMIDACKPNVALENNPAFILGAALGELALAGLNKLNFFASPTLVPFMVWLEQLIAESTGKHKTGILPVLNEVILPIDYYNHDHVFVYLRLKGEDDIALEEGIANLKSARHPVIELSLNSEVDILQEFFRWELAIAVASSILSINPFDQPDVESAKQKTRQLMLAYEKNANIFNDTPIAYDDDSGIEIYTQVDFQAYVQADAQANQGDVLHTILNYFLAQAQVGNYLALMAYLPVTPSIDALLKDLRLSLYSLLKIATTLGYGPRFLHSTGQLHKGDKNKGLFIQITHTPPSDVPIPGEKYTFGHLISAQAQGDYQALTEAGRRVLRLHITGDIVSALEKLNNIISF